MTLAPLVTYNNVGTNVYAQKANTPPSSPSPGISGNVVNSKYLSITKHKYTQGVQGGLFDRITGTIVNTSIEHIGFVTVYAALYGKDNMLITMKHAPAGISSLKAGDKSPFTITVALRDVDHYALFSGGTPS